MTARELRRTPRKSVRHQAVPQNTTLFGFCFAQKPSPLLPPPLLPPTMPVYLVDHSAFRPPPEHNVNTFEMADKGEAIFKAQESVPFWTTTLW